MIAISSTRFGFDPGGYNVRRRTLEGGETTDLIYLCEKTGRFLPRSSRGRYEVLRCLTFRMGRVGPMLGLTQHLRQYVPAEVPYATERYTNKATRPLQGYGPAYLRDKPLRRHRNFIADIAIYPWLVSHERQGQSWEDSPNLARWDENIAARLAAERTLEVGSDLRPYTTDLEEDVRDTLFGNRGRAGV